MKQEAEKNKMKEKRWETGGGKQRIKKQGRKKAAAVVAVLLVGLMSGIDAFPDELLSEDILEESAPGQQGISPAVQENGEETALFEIAGELLIEETENSEKTENIEKIENTEEFILDETEDTETEKSAAGVQETEGSGDELLPFGYETGEGKTELGAEEEGKEMQPVTQAEPQTPVSGDCGLQENTVIWQFSEGVLTISGTGEMKDWTAAEQVPWHSFGADIHSLIILEGVTGAGDYSFYGLSGLENTEIADSVVRIGRFAFGACSGVRKMEIG